MKRKTVVSVIALMMVLVLFLGMFPLGSVFGSVGKVSAADISAFDPLPYFPARTSQPYAERAGTCGTADTVSGVFEMTGKNAAAGWRWFFNMDPGTITFERYVIVNLNVREGKVTTPSTTMYKTDSSTFTMTRRGVLVVIPGASFSQEVIRVTISSVELKNVFSCQFKNMGIQKISDSLQPFPAELVVAKWGPDPSWTKTTETPRAKLVWQYGFREFEGRPDLITPTATITNTPTLTKTQPATKTATFTKTVVSSKTPTATKTVVPTKTGTVTKTPVLTNTSTNVPNTATPTSTATKVPDTATPTMTKTPTATATKVPTSTPTQTPTATGVPYTEGDCGHRSDIKIPSNWDGVWVTSDPAWITADTAEFDTGDYRALIIGTTDFQLLKKDKSGTIDPNVTWSCFFKGEMPAARHDELLNPLRPAFDIGVQIGQQGAPEILTEFVP